MIVFSYSSYLFPYYLSFYGNYNTIDTILLCSLFFLLLAPEGMLRSQIKMTAVISYAKEIKWWNRSCPFLEIHLFFQLEIFSNNKSDYWNLNPVSMIMKPHGKFSCLEIFARFKLLLHLLLPIHMEENL